MLTSNDKLETNASFHLSFPIELTHVIDNDQKALA